MKSESGFSLIELIIVMVLVAVLAGFVGNMIFYEVNIFNLITSRSNALQNSRRTLQTMSRDIRQIMRPDDIFEAAVDSLRFNDVNNFMITYSFVNGQLSKNSDPLVNFVDDFQFTYYDDSGNPLVVPVGDPSNIRSISLKLTTTVNGKSLKMQTKVTPRNF